MRGPTGSAGLVSSGGQRQGTVSGGRAAARDLRLPRLYALLRADPGWPVRHEAQERRETPDAQADGVAPGAGASCTRHWPRSTSGSPPFCAGHYGYSGRPHDYPALNGFYREVRRTWLRCLRRRSQKSRRMGWPEFETLTARFACQLQASLAHGRRRGYDAGYPREEPSAGKPPALETNQSDSFDSSRSTDQPDVQIMRNRKPVRTAEPKSGGDCLFCGAQTPGYSQGRAWVSSMPLR
ncbi:hypothetical protein GGD65_004167 [Bradyrhizobium sp. CIR18]|nr:hypothetical protein [Bradyrhizobium sp. CIR18]